ncbi:MAG TPA: universal stress protein [Vicinamibacterales bacterium]|nr:universal stress protein [Vicinamibacterales bacterium]
MKRILEFKRSTPAPDAALTRTVTVATDLSEHAGTVARYGARVARLLEADLRLVHYQSSAVLVIPAAGESSLLPLEDAGMQGRLSLLAAGLREDGLVIETELAQGSPRQLTEQVDHEHLVVIGARRRRWLSMCFRPSLVARLVAARRCPVLVIPIGADSSPPTQLVYVADADSSVSTTSVRHYAEILAQRLGASLDVVRSSQAQGFDPTHSRTPRQTDSAFTKGDDRKGVLLVLPAFESGPRLRRVAFEQMVRASDVPVLLVSSLGFDTDEPTKRSQRSS